MTGRRMLAVAGIALAALLSAGCVHDAREMVADVLREEVISRADSALALAPVTVTDFVAEQSEGGIHDFYSQADYFWPDPNNPGGAYKSHDGESNPNVFKCHRQAMIRLSRIVGDLTSAWLVTGDEAYARAVEPHVRAWFMDQETMMAPNMLYAQAIIGKRSGWSIGIIDSIHLVEVAQALLRLEQGGMLDKEVAEGTKEWFRDFIEWLTTTSRGEAEMHAANNHGTCWALQVSAFARYTGDEETLDFCRKRFKEVLMFQQMAPDGSFPMETRRTKSYAYSIFNLDAMAGLCQILSTPEDDLWEYTTEEGHNMRLGVDFLVPYIEDKSMWPYGEDIVDWNEWPVAQPFLVLAWYHSKTVSGTDGTDRWFRLWESLEHFPEHAEVLRNLPLRNPLIWL